MALKKIQYDVRLLSTEKTLQGKTPIVYTNDLNSAEFVFNILDTTAEQLAGATATTLIYMRDGSFFQNSDVNLDGNTFTYLLKENEGNHNGFAKIQLVVKIGTAEYASQLYNFEVVSGLETKVATEVMIHDWTTLTRDARAYIDQFVADEAVRQATFVANEQDRQLAFEAAEALRKQKETERQEAESGRIETEQSRADAETARKLAEETREGNEQTRQAQETERVSLFADMQTALNLKANKSQEAWITPTLLNGVTNYASGLAPVRYHKNEFNTVCLDGISTSVPTGTTIFTLPVGYRPSKRLFISTVTDKGFGWIRIDSDGSVQLGSGFPSTVYISYGGIAFRAER